MACPTLRAPQVKRMCTKENQHSPIALVRSHWHSDKAPSFSLVRVDGLFFFFSSSLSLNIGRNTTDSALFCGLPGLAGKRGWLSAFSDVADPGRLSV